MRGRRGRAAAARGRAQAHALRPLAPLCAWLPARVARGCVSHLAHHRPCGASHACLPACLRALRPAARLLVALTLLASAAACAARRDGAAARTRVSCTGGAVSDSAAMDALHALLRELDGCLRDADADAAQRCCIGIHAALLSSRHANEGFLLSYCFSLYSRSICNLRRCIILP